MLLSDPPPIVMCDFDSRTARWGLDVPATLPARADEVMNAECPLLGGKADITLTYRHDLLIRLSLGGTAVYDRCHIHYGDRCRG